VRSGDTLFSTVRPYLRKIAYVGNGLNGEIASTGFCVLRPRPVLDSRFLFYLAQWDWYVDAVTSQQRGVSYPAVRDEDLRRVEIPLPPLSEQRRIAAALDDHVSRLDATTSALIATHKRVKHGIALVLDRSFRDAGEWQRLGNLFKVSIGTTPSRARPDFWSGPISWVSSGEVAFNRISATRETISQEALGNRETRLHPPGTVLIAMIGEGKTRGQAAILDIPAAHNQNSASIRVSETKHSPEYVYWYLVSQYEANRRAASGGNQPALNKSRVEDILLPVTSEARQREIVEEIESATAIFHRLDASIAKVEIKAAALRSSLLAAAFSGKLVPQDPNDEPAAVLLKRINAEHGYTTTPRRSHRTAAPPKTTSKVPAGVQEELSL
jgi:type I restriction enzyme S subunit